MDKQQFLALIDKYLEGHASIEEEQMLLNYYGSFQHSRGWDEKVLGVKEEIEKRVLSRIQNHVSSTRAKGPVKLWPRIAAAAAILLIVGSGLFFYTSRPVVNRNSETVNQNDIDPGRNTATITLANGKTIQLSEAKTGVVIDASGLKYNDNTAVISGNPSVIPKEERDLLNNTDKRFNSVELAKGSVLPYGRDDGGSRQNVAVATPRGGTYQIILPDGTKVWLNAASELSFPSAFTGLGNRKVELSGEAYFEVAKDKAHPFIVETSKQQVEVLGTHFNINSYADEPATKTTLLEGSVAVRHLDDRRDDVTLKPNQQATLVGNNRITVKKVNPELAIAWKNGIFDFKNTPLEAIMKQVSRWYNVEIVYEDNAVKTETISGAVSRYDKVSRVLKVLEFTGSVKFAISGQKIMVKSNK